ncbi:MAG: methionine--tRNA ligase, partial [Phycisphaerae bacterium]|nr:methionine--tRNA ligase [Phycisphaerae bacterium]
MPKTFYVATPIYYVNDVPHIGHAYTTIAADVLARYNRFRGHDTFFLTGTDEHADKVARAARDRGITPVALADEMAERFKALWQELSISNDDFLRTTEPRHEKQVEEVFRRFHAAGDIYVGQYEGWYCTPCESYWLENALVDGNCPQCNRPVEHLKEPAYFFRLSKYEDRLREHIEVNPDFVRPRTRRNEVLGRLREGLQDVCVSRKHLGWGIPLPLDTNFTIYVWIDALLNYITGVEYIDSGERWRFWPADVQLVGKDILWFHAVVWPCMLFSLDVPLPKCVVAHGWWTSEGVKMSKSLGNFVDPWKYCNEYGTDAFRYFLLRQ